MNNSSKNFDIRKICPVCDSKSYRVFYTRNFYEEPLKNYVLTRYGSRVRAEDFSGIPFELRECLSCGLRYQMYVPTEIFAEKLYSRERTDDSMNYKIEADISYYTKAAREVEKISLLFSKKPYMIRVLDFGAGWGYWVKMAKAYGYDAYGFDLSTERADYARKSSLHFFTSMEELSKEKFDFIHTDQVFEHVNEPVELFKKVVSSLKAGGILHMIVPDGTSAESLIQKKEDGVLKLMQPLEHVNGFTHESLYTIAEKVGLERVEPLFIAKKLLPRISLTQNLQYLQDSIKAFYTQKFSTNVYFVKK